MDNSDIRAEYRESGERRIVVFERGDRRAALTQPRSGYGMIVVRTSPDAPELERYYGLDMALDHVAKLLGVDPSAVPVPNAAKEMGM